MNHLFGVIVLAAATLLVVPGEARADQTVRCESVNDRYQSCSVNTYGGVRLTRQLSNSGCWQGDTWGFDRNRIWVTRGCRAEFRIGSGAGSSSSSSRSSNGDKIAAGLVLGAIAGVIIANSRDDDRDRNRNRDNRYDDGSNYGYGRGRSVVCESESNRYTWCNVNVGRNDRVEIRRQLSRSPCVYGRSWGVERRRLWVDDGCRAEFTLY